MTCQHISNGDFKCGTDGDHQHVGDNNECGTNNYISSERVQQFGVDCCIKEAQYNMDNFSNISISIISDIFDNDTVSYLIKLLNVFHCNFIVIAGSYI